MVIALVTAQRGEGLPHLRTFAHSALKLTMHVKTVKVGAKLVVAVKGWLTVGTLYVGLSWLDESEETNVVRSRLVLDQVVAKWLEERD